MAALEEQGHRVRSVLQDSHRPAHSPRASPRVWPDIVLTVVCRYRWSTREIWWRISPARHRRIPLLTALSMRSLLPPLSPYRNTLFQPLMTALQRSAPLQCAMILYYRRQKPEVQTPASITPAVYALCDFSRAPLTQALVQQHLQQQQHLHQ